jgi:hypothetical protein
MSSVGRDPVGSSSSADSATGPSRTFGCGSGWRTPTSSATQFSGTAPGRSSCTTPGCSARSGTRRHTPRPAAGDLGLSCAPPSRGSSLTRGPTAPTRSGDPAGPDRRARRRHRRCLLREYPRRVAMADRAPSGDRTHPAGLRPGSEAGQPRRRLGRAGCRARRHTHRRVVAAPRRDDSIIPTAISDLIEATEETGGQVPGETVDGRASCWSALRPGSATGPVAAGNPIGYSISGNTRGHR